MKILRSYGERFHSRMIRPSKQQIAEVKSALREIHAELLGWDPHILVAFDGQAQKAQIIARMKQLGWHYVDDPSNETDDVSMVEFSLGASSQAAETASDQRGKAQRRNFAPMFAAFGTLSVVLGAIWGGIDFYWDYRMSSLKQAGTQTTAEIERTYSEPTRGGRDYYVSYRFVDKHGAPHENEEALTFDEWKVLRHGDPISVSYLANDPSQNASTSRVKSIADRSLSEKVMPAGVPWTIAGCFFLGYWLRKRRQ